MTEPDDIDDAQAREIDQRIRQAFAFIRDMIGAPTVLEEIPDQATLFFRDITWRGQLLRLTVHPSNEHPGQWLARVSGPPEVAAASRRWIPPIHTRGKGMGGKWGSPPTYPESGQTPEAALDALEEKLHDADDPGWASRHVVGR